MDNPQRKWDIRSQTCGHGYYTVIPAKAGISGGGGQVAGWTYIVANKPHGVLYIGVAANLAQRVQHHREGKGSKFCARYNLKLLVLAEHHDMIDDAIRREKLLKEWKREWKLELIERSNPEWRDLFDDIRE